MSVNLRFAGVSDVPVIAELIRGLAHFEKLESEVTMTEDMLEKNLFGTRPYAEALLAEEGGAVVGFALFFHNFSTFLAQPGIYLEDLFVIPEQRGQGVGRALLERLAQVAVERECRRLEWAVLDWNRAAIDFYERLGATPNSEWTVYRLTGEALLGLARQ
ncbi:MAG TPA: GNAT family N-acetyltransferase [Candidatus Dormibacteraeota bacterium]|nr:GNAT family N-acetyltransferase [Candidatus Dormibacteraeota bacterium]